MPADLRIGMSGFIQLFRESRRCDSLFHQADVVHHPKATVQNLKDFVDLHPAVAVAVVEDRVATPPRLRHRLAKN